MMVAHVVRSFLGLIGSQLLGIPALVAMDDDTLARWLRPVLTHYLTDPAP